ncbi:MAG TPA: maleylpyruvate isomerase family mycothiol-dependent enzyme [Acidimicrobiales bacterium]|nr:maleylpyruvate isomerase family mycothiol-dependent enzyme [Acidimicrobiales bacterium]
MTDPRLSRYLDLYRRGEQLVLAQVASLDDAACAEPCALPGWSRSDLLAHLARNADALGNLLAWARTGVETPMYASAEQRAADIAASATQAPGPLRADVTSASDRLAAAVEALPAAAWDAPVRTASGRAIAAAEVPWMRVRESWVHAVDLRTGVGFADLPPEVVVPLIDEVAGGLAGREDCPVLTLIASDGGGPWTVGPAAADPTEVRGTAHDLLAWIIGRHDGAGTLATPDATPPPPAPRWL